MPKEKTCKHCKKKVSINHYCETAGRDVWYNNDDDFLISFVVAAATENPILGTMIGGNPLAAMIGAEIGGSEHHAHDHHVHDSRTDYSDTNTNTDSSAGDGGGGQAP